jgi:hypothetical protein
MRMLLAVLRVAWEGPFEAAQAPEGLRRALGQAAGADDLAGVEARLREVQARVLARYEELVEAPVA